VSRWWYASRPEFSRGALKLINQQTSEGNTFSKLRAAFEDIMEEQKATVPAISGGTAQSTAKSGSNADWWKKRVALDKRLETLMTDIEEQWLGPWKVIVPHAHTQAST
jgi:hypothetical protein